MGTIYTVNEDGVVQPLVASADPTGVEGGMYYNDVAKRVKYFNGTNWIILDSGDITGVTAGDGLTGGGVTGDVQLDSDLSSPSGLALIGVSPDKTLEVADSLAGTGLQIAAKVMSTKDDEIDHDALLNFLASEHFTEASIDHVNIQNIGTNSHAAIDTHIADTANPHTVTLQQSTTAGNVTTTDVKVNSLIVRQAAADIVQLTRSLLDLDVGENAPEDGQRQIIFNRETAGNTEWLWENSSGDVILNHDTNVEILRHKASGTRLGGAGATVNEFSIDGTFAGDSDVAVPTEKATKTLHDSHANLTNNPHSVTAAQIGTPADHAAEHEVGGGDLLAHDNITGSGSNTHAQIDTHIADGTIHYTEASIDHVNILNIGSNAHSVIDTHLGSSANPHSVTHAQLSDVTTPHVAADIEANAIITSKILDANVTDAKLASVLFSKRVLADSVTGVASATFTDLGTLPAADLYYVRFKMTKVQQGQASVRVNGDSGANYQLFRLNGATVENITGLTSIDMSGGSSNGDTFVGEFTVDSQVGPNEKSIRQGAGLTQVRFDLGGVWTNASDGITSISIGGTGSGNYDLDWEVYVPFGGVL